MSPEEKGERRNIACKITVRGPSRKSVSGVRKKEKALRSILWVNPTVSEPRMVRITRIKADKDRTIPFPHRP
jgi:hypothetical protein